MATPFMSGKTATAKVFVDGSPVTVKVQSWTVTQRSVKAEDGLCGENRPHIQTLVQGYDINLSCLIRDTLELENLLTNVENDDANVMPLDKAVSMTLKPLDGTSQGFVTGGEVTIDDWSLNSGGQAERLKLTIPIRAQYVKAVQTL